MQLILGKPTVGAFDYEILRTISDQETGGAAIGECVTAVSHIRQGNFATWTDAWKNMADCVAAEAMTALHIQEDVTARGAFLRASNYYRAAAFYVPLSDALHDTLAVRSRECCHQAIALLSTPRIDILSIPFAQGHLPGYFISGGSGQRPTLLALGGFDSTGEELLHWIGFAAAARGWNCLIFEGPGQWNALQLNPGLTLRPDYEVPVQAVVDYALTRSEVDHERIALIGYSLGGYLAPRAATFEPRIKACIADSLIVDVGEAFRATWPAPLRTAPAPIFDRLYTVLSQWNSSARWAFNHARWTMGIHHPHEFFAAWEPYTLSHLSQSLRCPLLCLFGEDEIAATSSTLVQATMRYIASLPGERTVHVFTRKEGAASHCQMGNLSHAQAAIFQWLDRTMQEPPQTEQQGRLHVPLTARAILETYHGKGVLDLLPAETPSQDEGQT